jgi:hypothetical protein
MLITAGCVEDASTLLAISSSRLPSLLLEFECSLSGSCLTAKGAWND